MHERDELDHLLRSALSTYADPGPGSGLEERIAARIRTESALPTRNPRLLWALHLAAAACLLLVVLFTPKPPHLQLDSAEQSRLLQQPHTTIALSQAPRAASTAGLFNQARAGVRKSQQPILVTYSPASLPKLDVFPTPRPVTATERLLASQAPASELQALAGAPMQADLPPSFASIHNPPLEPPDEGEN
jgi:hypothetical protein